MTNTIIIGGGHNGLVCAAYLAKAGRKVTVLEAADQVGGAAATREFTPGFKASCAHLLYLLDKDISKELGLESHGLRMARSGLKTIALAEDSNHITISANSVEGGGLSAQDKAAYKEYRRFMSKFAGVIGGIHNKIRWIQNKPTTQQGLPSDLSHAHLRDGVGDWLGEVWAVIGAGALWCVIGR